MIFRVIVCVAIVLPSLFSCKTLSNNFSDLKSECGTDVIYGGEYLKFLSPSGVELTGGELRSLRLDAEGREDSVPFTAKGCALKNDLEAVAVRSTVKDRHWGVVVSDIDLQKGTTVRLKDISSWNPKFQCPSNSLSNGTVRSPLTWDQNLVSVLPQVMVGNEKNFKVVDAIANQDIDLNFLEKDGEHEVSYTWLDPYAGKKSANCKYQIDRTVPTVSDELKQVDSLSQYRVSGGSRLRFAVEDKNAASLEYCLYRPGETCQILKGGPEAFVTFPSAGRWCLQTTAVDQAGNRSTPQLKCGISIAEGELALIQANIQNARLTDSKVPILQAILILRALKQYFGLSSDEERQSVEKEMISAAVSYGSQSYLRGIYKERRYDNMLRFSNSWANDMDGIFEIRNEYGKVISEQNAADLDLGVSTSKGDVLISQNANNQTSIFQLIQNKLVRTQTIDTPTTERPFESKITWNPWEDSLSIAEQRSRTENSKTISQLDFIFYQKAIDSKFEIKSAVKSSFDFSENDSSGLRIQPMRRSKDGEFAAASTRMSLIIFRRNKDNKYELLKSINERTRDVVILQDDQTDILLAVTEDKSIKAYDLNSLELLQNELNLKASTNFNDGSFIQTERQSAYFHDQGINKVSIENGKLVLKYLSDELFNFNNSFWTWNKNNNSIYYQTFRDVTMFQILETSLDKKGVFAFETPLAQRPYWALPYVHIGGNTLTSSDDSILRTWAIEPLVGKFIGRSTNISTEISALLKKLVPPEGEIPYWIFPKIEPYSVTNIRTGKDSISKVYKSQYSSDFVALSTHNVLVFYDSKGNVLGEINTDISTLSKIFISFLDASRLVVLDENLEYRIIEKQGSSYREVFKGNSLSKANSLALKAEQLLKFNLSPESVRAIELAETMISPKPKSKPDGVKIRNDLKYLSSFNQEDRLVTIYEGKNGIFAKYDEILTNRDISQLKWLTNEGNLVIQLSGDRSILYNPSTKISTHQLTKRDIFNQTAAIYDNELSVSYHFQIDFLGSTLSSFESNAATQTFAFNLSPNLDDGTLSDESIVKAAKGVSGYYLIEADLRKIQKDMCKGLQAFLKFNLRADDWEGLLKSDNDLCDHVD